MPHQLTTTSSSLPPDPSAVSFVLIREGHVTLMRNESVYVGEKKSGEHLGEKSLLYGTVRELFFAPLTALLSAPFTAPLSADALS